MKKRRKKITKMLSFCLILSTVHASMMHCFYCSNVIIHLEGVEMEKYLISLLFKT